MNPFYRDVLVVSVLVLIILLMAAIVTAYWPS